MGQAYVGITLKGVPLNAGLLNYIDPTDNLDGTLSVPELKGNFDSDSAGVYEGNIVTKTIPAATTGVGLTPALPQGVSYLVANYNNGAPYWDVITDSNLIGPRMLSFATVYKEGTYINWLGWDSMGLGLSPKLAERSIRTMRFAYESGLVITTNVAKNVFSTAGYVWFGPVRKSIVSFDSSIIPIKFWYHSGGVWTNSDSAVFINNQYDDGTNLVALQPNRWVVNWVYRSAGAIGRCVIILGQEYHSYAEAAAELEPTTPPATAALGVLTARIIVQNGSTSPTILSAFENPIGSTTVSNHETLGGLLGGTASNHYHFSYFATVAAAKVPTGWTDGSSICYIRDTQQWYRYSSASGATADDFNVITTGDGGTSRWVSYNSVIDGHGVPVGVQNTAGWTVTYDPATRIVTATPSGTQYVWVDGKRFSYSAPQQVTHAVTTPSDYFIYFNSAGVLVSSSTAWDLSSTTTAPIAYVRYDTALTPGGYALIETHSSQRNPVAHKEFHETIGTYRVSGGSVSGLTTYAIADATNPALATINPDVASVVVADEDLRTTLNTFTQGAANYSKFSKQFTTNKWVWDNTDINAPYFQTGNIPQYNPASGGDALVNMTDLSHAVWWLFAQPTISASSNFRYIWVAPQFQYTASASNDAARTAALNLALAEDWRNLDLSGLPPEYAPLWRVTVEYRTGYTNNAYRLRVSDSRVITGSKAASGSFSGVSPSVHNNLTGRSDAGAHPATAITQTATGGELDSAVETDVNLALQRLSTYDSTLDWVTARTYRVGNVVRVTTSGFIGNWRCVVAHTAAASFATDVESGNWEIVSNSEGARELVTQNAHGFATKDVVYHNGTVYAKAKADVVATAEAVGIVLGVTTNKFVLAKTGKITVTGLTVGDYFLSDATAGLATQTEPTTVGSISKPLFRAISTTEAQINIMRGVVVGGGGVQTTVALSNNATTNVQDLSAYEGCSVNGNLYVNGTSDFRGTFMILVSKKATDGTYVCNSSFVSGDTDPGITVDITSAGVLQITLPSIAGFVNATFNYTIGAPQAGATFPLSVGESVVIPDGGALGSFETIAASKTLTALSPRLSYVNTPGAAVLIDLPTTNVKAGYRYRVEVVGATETNYVALRSSSAAEIDRIGGAGFIEVVALIDTPTTAANWKITDVYEFLTLTFDLATGAGTGASNLTGKTCRLARRNRAVNGFMPLTSVTTGTGAGNGISTSSTPVPVRFRPTIGNQFCASQAIDSGNISGMFGFLTTGNIIFYKVSEANWTSSASVTLVGSGFGFAYYI